MTPLSSFEVRENRLVESYILCYHHHERVQYVGPRNSSNKARYVLGLSIVV